VSNLQADQARLLCDTSAKNEVARPCDSREVDVLSRVGEMRSLLQRNVVERMSGPKACWTNGMGARKPPSCSEVYDK